MEYMESKTWSRRLFVGINTLFLCLLVVSMLLPLWNTVIVSFSPNLDSMQPGMKLWNHHWSLNGYSTVWNRLKLWLPFLNSVLVTLAGTFIHVLLSSLAGYVLIQKELPFRKTITSFILISMMIPSQAIMIPLYVINLELGLLNTLSALVISGLVSGFSVLVMRNFFSSVPYELLEASMIDGAGHFRIFCTLYLPLARAGLATITLFEFVSRWNDFTSPLLYLNDPTKYTLQIALNTIINGTDSVSSNYLITQNVKMAGVVIGLLPLLLIYPFVQKYFVKGIFIGAVKE